MHIQNPILRGFNPDPAICRVGDDYYIATSTFEWFPGVQIHHSRDLVHWRLLTHVLTRRSQLDMEGNIGSGGIWAPALSYDNGTFYLVFTDVKSRIGAFRDMPNYLVTAPDVTGPWSEPVFLNSSGFDPSLFHDDDGRKWLVNMLWDHRKGRNRFSGIVLQEYCPREKKLVGPRRNIFKGTDLGWTEAPHLYKKDGWYYLVTAEGGTQYNHAVTIARARNIGGPYEVDPQNPVLTSKDAPELALQKAGHASLVETQNGEWYMAHLCARPTADKFCTLGRESALQRCHWTADGWLRVDGGPHPSERVPAPNLPSHPFPAEPEKDDFDGEELNVHWSTLRVPAEDSWLTLAERPGWLRLYGRESPASRHRQSLVARRVQAFHMEAETLVEFEPDHFQHMAGLILYYDTDDFVYLRISRDDAGNKGLNVIESVGGDAGEWLEADVPLPEGKAVGLKVSVARDKAQFFYATEPGQWQPIGEPADVTHLSDDYPAYIRFTGMFVGLCAQDLAGRGKAADFDFFVYRELD